MSTALIILPDFLLILTGFSLARWMGFEPAFWGGLEKLIYLIVINGGGQVIQYQKKGA